MASRLYPTTRRLLRQVQSALIQLGYRPVWDPLTLTLVALYTAGLILLDRDQTNTRIADWLPARAHDAFNRLLRVLPFSTRLLMSVLVAWANRQGQTGYLVIDDVVVEKPFARLIPWVGWTYSTTARRQVRGFHLVVLLWCAGRWRIPVAFRFWRPQATCARQRYQTKLQLAWTMLTEVVATGLPVAYVVFDTLYTAGWLTKRIRHLGLVWVGVLPPRTKVHYQHKASSALELALRLKLSWRKQLDLRAASVVVYSRKYGTLRLVVTRNRHGNYEVLATNELTADLTTVVQRKRSRWSVETLFRDSKQLAGLGACQCRVYPAMVRHVAICLTTFTVLQLLRLRPEETLGEVKSRLQRQVLAGDMQPPAPLRGKVARAELLKLTA